MGCLTRTIPETSDPPMARHNTIGAWGERVAREYLLSKGYAIGAENTRLGSVEIDFIAFKDDRICFVEVKTRSTDFVDPLEAIDTRKRARMVRAADAYLHSNDIALEPQFDIVIVIGTPESGHTVEHIPDAFYPSLNNGF